MKRILVLLLLLSMPAIAATKYVNNGITCSDSPSNGSAASPFCTPQYGITQITGGDTLYIKAGTYPIQGGYWLITGPNGTSGQHTVISAYPTGAGTYESVVFTPTDSSTKIRIGNNNSSATQVSYFDVAGIDFRGASGGNSLENAIHCYGCAYVNFTDLKIDHTGQDALGIKYNSHHVTISGAVIHDTGTNGSYGEGIYVGSSSTPETPQGTGDNTNNITIINSTIYNTLGEGIELKPGTHDCIVDGNLIYNTTTTGVGSGGAAIEVNEAVLPDNSQAWGSNPNHIIRNNIVHNAGPAGGGDALFNSAIRLGTGGTAYNNLIYNVISPGFGVYMTNGMFGNSDSYQRKVYHNTIDASSARAVGTSGSPTTDVKSNIGPSSANNVVTSSGLYIAQGTDWHLARGASGARDLGSTTLRSTVATDIAGTSRTNYGNPDYGAYEYAGTSVAAASCSSANVNTAIGTATTYDTVAVPACGSTSWSGINLNKQITLQGQTSCTGARGTLSCTAGTTISGSSGAINISAAGRITGFTFTVGSANALIEVSNNTFGWRVDHSAFNGSGSGRGIGAKGSGLVDHCYFTNVGNGVSPDGGDNRDFRFQGDYNWSQPLNAGSANAIYMEDNKFNYTISDLDGAYDAYSGARLVFRYNYVRGVTIGSHGLDSTDVSRSTLLEEVYGNDSSASFWTFWNTRGGVFYIFNNTTSTFDIFIDIRNYRSSTAFNYQSGGGLGNGNKCDGTNWVDGNTVGGHGYPCRDQPGRGPETAPSTDWSVIGTSAAVYSEVLSPGYVFGNTYNGSTPSLANDVNIAGAANPSPEAGTYHIIHNRDFFYEVSGAGNGTSGVGSGTLAQRPATCSNATYPGPAYWATDQGNWNQSGSGTQGVLYVCSAPNTWTAYYTPYTYPHPLASGGTVSVPTVDIPRPRSTTSRR